MADLNLTQAEADALIVLEKHKVNDGRHSFPLGGDIKRGMEKYGYKKKRPLFRSLIPPALTGCPPAEYRIG